MKKVINMAALIFFVWLVLGTLRVPDMLLGFLLAGAVPFTTISLPPSMMLAIETTIVAVFLFEIAARRNDKVAHIRQNLLHLTARTKTLRRLNRA